MTYFIALSETEYAARWSDWRASAKRSYFTHLGVPLSIALNEIRTFWLPSQKVFKHVHRSMSDWFWQIPFFINNEDYSVIRETLGRQSLQLHIVFTSNRKTVFKYPLSWKYSVHNQAILSGWQVSNFAFVKRFIGHCKQQFETVRSSTMQR